MKFNGFQKMTLLDYPGKVACTLFTAGCNFKCPFCHNSLLVTNISDSDTFDSKEILSFLSKRVGLLDGVCITGGEPLLQKELPDFLSEVKAIGFKIKLDTNGSLPDKLKELVNNRLVDYVAMDIKNSPEKYPITAGAEIDISKVKESVDFLISSGIDYEFRTTVVSPFHEEDDFEKIGRFINGAKDYYLQGFVDSGHLISDKCSAISRDRMEAMRKRVLPFVKNASLRGV
ncbi:MAG: anaerobic ribonucleoside-triphosphate reductase activating protein [Clostridia bacterium]|nr:anaerobic ribonucleoside-triphosphate reductase activating protein [Clostridia bacterium]